ncbi:MAG TPA: hypothetical protein DF383_03475, partial [Deltaproteobacteria bacterium]|nr:hypothetical protein [Deltaproteobacteria bacterium]
LIVDRFGDLICFQTLSAGMETFKENIIQYLRERFAPRSIVERNDASVRQFEELPLLRQTVYGEAPAEAAFQFSGKHFSFQPLEGQKTGFFLDQRCNAAAAARYAFGEMLDVFSYVGQFGIHAAAKAEKVLCVDASAAALAQAERNAELNELRNVETHEANAFDFLKECDRQGRAFDVISLDPPAFV